MYLTRLLVASRRTWVSHRSHLLPASLVSLLTWGVQSGTRSLIHSPEVAWGENHSQSPQVSRTWKYTIWKHSWWAPISKDGSCSSSLQHDSPAQNSGRLPSWASQSPVTLHKTHGKRRNCCGGCMGLSWKAPPLTSNLLSPPAESLPWFSCWQVTPLALWGAGPCQTAPSPCRGRACLHHARKQEIYTSGIAQSPQIRGM